MHKSFQVLYLETIVSAETFKYLYINYCYLAYIQTRLDPDRRYICFHNLGLFLSSLSRHLNPPLQLSLDGPNHRLVTRVILKLNLSFKFKVTHLVISRPDNFRYQPGDYVFIRIPDIAQHEWHPFTISSAPEMKGQSHYLFI